MKYRKIPRCNDVEVSEIALGCEGFLGKSEAEYRAFVNRAMELGVNFIDMYTSNPEFQTNFGKCIVGRRDRFVLQGHLCSVWENNEYLRTRDMDKVKAAFEGQLERLGTDYLDIGMIHYSDAESDWEDIMQNGVMDYCLALKKEGKIRSIGLSSHNPVVAKKAVESGLIDVLMFSVNAAYDLQPPSEDCMELFDKKNYIDGMGVNPDRRELYELCERENVAIDVMKAFGGGDMLNEKLSPFGVAFNEYQCMEYCLTRPGVVSIMAGCRTIEELERLAGYYETPKEERDYTEVLSKISQFNFKGNCMYCGHCAPCTVGINVAEVNKYLNLCLAQKMVPETVADHYKLLAHHASECIGCGRCEKNCPFGVSIIEKMKHASEVFGY